MKTKKLLLALVLFGTVSLNAKSQTQPPNAGFESWVTIGPYENPANWSSFNNFYSYGMPEMSFKTTDANSGSYALKLISDTATIPPPLGTGVLDTTAGFVFLGGPDMSNPGISYTERPESMQAFVKGTIAPGGNTFLLATLRKWNTTTHVRDQVGMAIYNMTSSIAHYTQISVPFNYSLSDIPDTLEIKIMAGDVGPGGKIMPGNIFYVDDISFTFTVGINEPSKDNMSIAVYPDPAINNIAIYARDLRSTIYDIRIYDVIGNLILEKNSINNKTSIDVSTFSSGIYFVKVKTEKGMAVEKFLKE